MAVTRSESIKLLRLRTAATRLGHHLSDFEREKIREVCARVSEFGLEAEITAAEWIVLDDSLDAMLRVFGREGRAA